MTDGTRSIECDEVELLLLELRDGELDTPTAEAVQSHLAECARCQRTQAWDAKLPRILCNEALPAPPVGLVAEVRRRVRRRRRWLMPLATAASLAVCATLAAWQPWVVNNEIQVVVHAPAASDDFAEFAMLFEPPPVDSFEVLGRQQSGYVAVLKRIDKE
jgi:anti-sigma factor RsiW